MYKSTSDSINGNIDHRSGRHVIWSLDRVTVINPVSSGPRRLSTPLEEDGLERARNRDRDERCQAVRMLAIHQVPH